MFCKSFLSHVRKIYVWRFQYFFFSTFREFVDKNVDFRLRLRVSASRRCRQDWPDVPESFQPRARRTTTSTRPTIRRRRSSRWPRRAGGWRSARCCAVWSCASVSSTLSPEKQGNLFKRFWNSVRLGDEYVLTTLVWGKCWGCYRGAFLSGVMLINLTKGNCQKNHHKTR